MTATARRSVAALTALASAKAIGGLAMQAAWRCPGGDAATLLPGWWYAALTAAFCLAGLVLFVGARGDDRARLLGACFVMFSGVFADRLVLVSDACDDGVLRQLSQWLLVIQPTAFAPALFWAFVWRFPRVQPGLWPSAFAAATHWTTAIVGGVLFAGNLVAGPAQAGEVAPIVWLRPDADAGLFWVAGALSTIPGLALLLVKRRAARGDEHRRLAAVVAGLVVGVTPMVLDSLLSQFVPAYGRATWIPERRGVIAVLLTIAALVAPAATAYAVVVDRALDVRLMLRRAVRYSLARHTVILAIVLPFAAFVLKAVANPEQTLAQLATSSLTGLWPVVLVGGLAVLASHRWLLREIDRVFFREHHDARVVLARLVDQSRKAQSVEELTTLICENVDVALHLERTALLLKTGERDEFIDLTGRVRGLGTASPLVQLVGGASTPLDIDLSASGSVLTRLPDVEREWLADAGARLMVPFQAPSGALVAILLLGEKKSDTPFTEDDRLMLTAIAAAAAPVLERRLAQQVSAALDTRATVDYAAQQCERCGRVTGAADDASCRACGAPLVEALLPAVLAGKFAIERRVGAGGMGVVFRATDLTLRRVVAIKTLPRLEPRHASALRREARLMASLQHPHLAQVYGLDVWRGRPALVMEFMAGGTLSERIRRGSIELSSVVATGSAIAEALDAIHRTGLLHLDVKPSNIGYSNDRVPKLMDFGLARIAEVTGPAGHDLGTTRSWTNRSGSPVLTDSDHGTLNAPGAAGLRGTLAFMSPEALRHAPPHHRFDLWALGVTLYEALTGRNPFVAATVDEIVRRIVSAPAADVRTGRPDCPGPLADLIAALLSLDPAHRPATAADVVASCRSIQQTVGRETAELA